jgi:hypothetical protein
VVLSCIDNGWQAVDAQGEELRDGGDHFEARVQQIPEGVSIDVEQTDMSNGLYSVSFVLNDPGMQPDVLLCVPVQRF